MKAALFVDIDGVFHAVGDRGFEHIDNALAIVDSPDLFQWAPILWRLIESYQIDVVVHSSWRHIYPADDIIARFPAPMQHRIAGVTKGGDRYQSILDYVEDHGIGRFAVLDDLPGAFPAGWPYLIVCPRDRGVSDVDVQDKIRRFLQVASPVGETF